MADLGPRGVFADEDEEAMRMSGTNGQDDGHDSRDLALAIADRPALGDLVAVEAGPQSFDEWAVEPCVEEPPKLFHCLVADREENEDVAAEAATFVHHFLGPEARKGQQLGVQADSLGVSRFTAPLRVNEFASASLELHFMMLRSLISSVAHEIDANRLEPVAILKSTLFDETPCDLRIDELPSIPESDALQPPPKPSKRRKASSKPQNCKVLQTSLTLLLIFRRPDGHYVELLVPVPSALQVQDHGTADVTRACLKDAWAIAGLEQLMGKFAQKVFVNTCDRASSNLKFLASARRDADEKSCQLFFPCVIHRISTVIVQQFGLMATDISRMIAVALAQRPVGAFDLLRECISLCLRTGLKRIPVATLPTESSRARLFRTSMLEEFWGQSSEDRLHRERIADLLNGDWESAEVRHFCPAGHCDNLSDCERKLDELAKVLLPRLTHIFPRHRWVGSDRTICDIGALVAPHGLLCKVLPVWVRCIQQHRSPSRKDFKRQQCELERGLPDKPEHEDDILLMHLTEHPDEAEDVAQPGRRSDPQAWVIFNTRMRQKSLDFASSEPLHRLVITRKVLRPAIQLMDGALRICGEEWTKERDIELMEGKQERFRPIEIQVLLSEFTSELRRLICTKETWASMPLEGCSSWTSTTAFRILSKAGGASEFLLNVPFRTYPMKMFDLLDCELDTEWVAAEIAGDPVCMKDHFAAQHLKIGSEDSLATLRGVARNCTLGIQGIEARHASVRRFKVIGSGTWVAQALQVCRCLGKPSFQGRFRLIRFVRFFQVRSGPFLFKKSV
jgi:hypothetical protein